MEETDSNRVEDPQPSEETQPPQLSSIELRVLGALMEKQLTTPDLYPLTVNSLVSACNQKSSRDPVTNYQQGDIVRTLQGLEDKRFVRKEYGSRTDKYSQQFMQQLELGKKQQAILCLLMLRGPQTLSELSTRTQRMEQFTDKDDLTHCLERLCERELPLAIGLGFQPGQRGERFGHLFNGMPQVVHAQPATASSRKVSSLNQDDQDTLSLLESEVIELSHTVKALKSENEVLKSQLEKLYELTGNPLPADN